VNTFKPENKVLAIEEGAEQIHGVAFGGSSHSVNTSKPKKQSFGF
jgi:hypothetical protein